MTRDPRGGYPSRGEPATDLPSPPEGPGPGAEPPATTGTGLPWGIRIALPVSAAARVDIQARMDVERAAVRLMALVGRHPLSGLVWEEVKRREKLFAGAGVKSPTVAAIESVTDDVAAGRFA